MAPQGFQDTTSNICACNAMHMVHIYICMCMEVLRTLKRHRGRVRIGIFHNPKQPRVRMAACALPWFSNPKQPPLPFWCFYLGTGRRYLCDIYCRFGVLFWQCNKTNPATTPAMGAAAKLDGTGVFGRPGATWCSVFGLGLSLPISF